jgi:hypothetical protein
VTGLQLAGGLVKPYCALEVAVAYWHALAGDDGGVIPEVTHKS